MFSFNHIFTLKIEAVCAAVRGAWRRATVITSMVAALAFCASGAYSRDVETLIGKTLAAQGAAYPFTYIFSDSGEELYVITSGSSDNCGELYRFSVNAAGGLKQEVRVKFNTSDCNPTTIQLGESITGKTNAVFVGFSTPVNGQVSVKEFRPDGAATTRSFLSPDDVNYLSTTFSIHPSTNASVNKAAGFLYITTAGGANGDGAIYRAPISSTGAFSTPVLIFSFPGGSLGANPVGGAVQGPDGSLYGATLQGGDASAAACVNNNGCGIVYKLTPKTVGAAVVWSETVLYTFEGGADGNRPATPLTIDGKGNLYGTTLAGGVLAGTNVPPCGTYGAGNANDYGCGIVFELSKGASAPWAEHVLYAFTGGADGAQPKAQVTFSAGNLYGTAYAGGNLDATTYPNCSADMKGGAPGCGVAFELKKPKTADTFPWTYVNLYTFKGGADGNGPMSPLLPIAAGKLFGATIAGGVLNNTGCNNGDGFTNAPGCGALFELKP